MNLNNLDLRTVVMACLLFAFIIVTARRDQLDTERLKRLEERQGEIERTAQQAAGAAMAANGELASTRSSVHYHHPSCCAVAADGGARP